jgi:hypothetical protein
MFAALRPLFVLLPAARACLCLVLLNLLPLLPLLLLTEQVKDRPEVQEKLQRRIASVDVKIITPPRPGRCWALTAH